MDCRHDIIIHGEGNEFSHIITHGGVPDMEVIRLHPPMFLKRWADKGYADDITYAVADITYAVADKSSPKNITHVYAYLHRARSAVMAMGLHSRLGCDSPISLLPQSLIGDIARDYWTAFACASESKRKESRPYLGPKGLAKILCRALHPRLGSDSPMALLPQFLVKTILTIQ